jgi:hypothetical protein
MPEGSQPNHRRQMPMRFDRACSSAATVRAAPTTAKPSSVTLLT